MERTEIETRIKEIINTIVEGNTATENILPQTRFADIGITSADYIKLIVAIEEKFNIVVKDEYLIPENFQTFNDCINLINELLK